jgi:hypothetical protein
MNSQGLRLLRSVAIFALVAPQTSQTDATPRDLSVFRAVIEQTIARKAFRAADDKSPGQWLVVFDRTYRLCGGDLKVWCMPADTPQRLEAWLAESGGDAALLRAFVSRNRQTVVVGNPDREAAILEPSGPLETAGLSDNFWIVFGVLYPGARGWVRFSAPAYSDAGDAVVYVTYACGGLCGEGWLVRLSPVGSGWRVANWLSLVVS